MSRELPQISTPRLLMRALENHQAETLCTLANGPKIAVLKVLATVREDWEFRL
ncbi:hypothetical protein [Pseudomonas sp. GXZC]|uniref:hypothetical protein n=1 Tax=Pseudomonas sp. GXZC TaxID=3003351 RepID=UPI0022AA25A6|nr:hypothetical protein [Pseudomonas sp. GXZC]WAT30837.1 hypothetical protein OZ428_10955 [Pseudomonas sp. GXZC]